MGRLREESEIITAPHCLVTINRRITIQRTIIIEAGQRQDVFTLPMTEKYYQRLPF